MEKTVLISLPLDELQSIIIDCVNVCLKLHPNSPTRQNSQPQPDACDTEQAVKFLNDQGYPISESKLYKLTASREIPFKNFGRKLIFSRRELLSWVQSQTTDPENAATAAALTLAKSARRKRK